MQSIAVGIHRFQLPAPFVNQTKFAPDATDVGVINGLITDDKIDVERKGFQMQNIDNYLHVIMASNDKHVIWATPDERRYCVLDVSDSKMGDLAYFKALADELDNGGLEAMLHDLLERDISTFDPRCYPSTKALSNQIIESFSPEDQWLLETLVDGAIMDEKWGIHAKGSVFSSYKTAGGDMGSTGFGRWLLDTVRGTVATKATLTKDRVQVYRFPSLDDCRKQFEARVRQPINWETGMIA